MSTLFDKFLSQAIREYEVALHASGKVDTKTNKNIYLRGAKDFVQFLKTGKPLKRDERAPNT